MESYKVNFMHADLLFYCLKSNIMVFGFLESLSYSGECVNLCIYVSFQRIQHLIQIER